MSSKHQYLTNEEFSEAYDNKFELALYIIKIAQTKMNMGDDVLLSRLLSDLRKEAQHIIEERKAASK
ncbi:MAG: hypothetical protein P0S95_02035 [Rhabdochlamydiaceae bacterium]|nr:hypothetical protein [Candidatus Amphrikana amoebophyrae]